MYPLRFSSHFNNVSIHGDATMTEKREDLIPSYDKSNWGVGEWNNEPDRQDFIHAGFSCFILRNQIGCWCGYVGIPESHPYFGKDYNDIPVDVHGGITYADKCDPPICHIPEKGMPENVWWLGFDTAHAFDLCPSMHRRFQFGDTYAYRNMEYSINETKKLAEQLKKLA